MIVEGVNKKHNISEREITAAYDRLEATINTMDRETNFSCKSNHFDMLSAFDSNLETSPNQWKWRHVKGQGTSI